MLSLYNDAALCSESQFKLCIYTELGLIVLVTNPGLILIDQIHDHLYYRSYDVRVSSTCKYLSPFRPTQVIEDVKKIADCMQRT